jgi:hypothetical protein
MYSVFMYENRMMKPVEIGRWGRGSGWGRKMEGITLIKIYYIHISHKFSHIITNDRSFSLKNE